MKAWNTIPSCRTGAQIIEQCTRKLWRPHRPEDPQIYLNCRSCKSIACHNSRNQCNSQKLLQVQQDLQILHLPVHPLYCPGPRTCKFPRDCWLHSQSSEFGTCSPKHFLRTRGSTLMMLNRLLIYNSNNPTDPSKRMNHLTTFEFMSQKMSWGACQV